MSAQGVALPGRQGLGRRAASITETRTRFPDHRVELVSVGPRLGLGFRAIEADDAYPPLRASSGRRARQIGGRKKYVRRWRH